MTHKMSPGCRSRSFGLRERRLGRHSIRRVRRAIVGLDPTASRHPNLLLPLEAHWSPCTPSMTRLHMQQNKVHPAPIHDMSAHATERSTLHPSMTCLHMQQKGPGLHAHMSNLCTSEHEHSAPLPSYPFPHERLAICITCSHRKHAARMWKFVYVKPQIAPNSAYVTPCTVPRLSCFMHTHRACTVFFHSRTHTIVHWIFWYVLMSSCQPRIKRRDDMVCSTQQIVV